MVIKKDGLVLRAKGNSTDADIPDYSLRYSTGKTSMDKSREILLLLIGKHGFIMEVDSSLLNVGSNERDTVALRFLDSVKKMSIDFRYKKEKSASSNTILGLFRVKSSESHRILAFIPNPVWVKDDIREVMNPYGCRYYVLNKGLDKTVALNALQIGEWTDEDMNNNIRMIIFDCPLTGYMGINTTHLEIDEIRELLKI